MAAWCVASPLRLTFFFLLFYEVLAIKVNVRGANHICSSGAQVFHVNFGNGPIHQCDVMNTTPPSNNGKPSCAEKENERLKSSQGLYDSVKWGVSYHVNNLVNCKAPLLKISSRGFCPFMFCCTVHVFVSNFRLQFFWGSSYLLQMIDIVFVNANNVLIHRIEWCNVINERMMRFTQDN